MRSQRNFGNVLALVDARGLTDGDVLPHALPMSRVHDLFVAIHCAPVSGAPML